MIYESVGMPCLVRTRDDTHMACFCLQNGLSTSYETQSVNSELFAIWLHYHDGINNLKLQ